MELAKGSLPSIVGGSVGIGIGDNSVVDIQRHNSPLILVGMDCCIHLTLEDS